MLTKFVREINRIKMKKRKIFKILTSPLRSHTSPVPIFLAPLLTIIIISHLLSDRAKTERERMPKKMHSSIQVLIDSLMTVRYQ